MRSLAADDARPLVGTENAEHPFFSPDGRSVGFFADGKLKRVAPDLESVCFCARRSRSMIPTHVYDLGMMGFTLSGGRVHIVAGRPSALFAYRDSGGAWLLCQMYPGTVDELPAGSDVRTRDGIRFHTFRREAVTVVFWQEGAIVCALASDLPPAQVVELALAKAMKV